MSDDIKFRDMAAISLFHALLETQTIWTGKDIQNLLQCFHEIDPEGTSKLSKSFDEEIKKVAARSYQLADYLREARLKVFK